MVQLVKLQEVLRYGVTVPLCGASIPTVDVVSDPIHIMSYLNHKKPF